MSERDFRNITVIPINSINNAKESFKKKTFTISFLKRKILTIKAVIKSEVIILKRGNFRLNFIK